jgi:ACS family tartrate transporter-like MFS transporter
MKTASTPRQRPARPTFGEIGDRTLAKVRRRIIPVICLLYFVAFLDRNNIGFAKLTMSEDIGLTASAYGLGAGIFFIGYALFEIPSNGGMYRFGARKWIARILISWGICATAMALVNGETTFYVIRFLLGAAEAGFFPAVVFYLTLWFPAAQRVTVLGLFILAQPISNAIGAPVSGLLLNLDGLIGLHGWQWLYIIEGIPAVILGFLAPRLLTDRPEEAHWLQADERTWLSTTMTNELAEKQRSGSHSFLDGLKDRRALVYAFLNFGMVCGIYGFGLWLPTVVAGLGKLDPAQVGFIVVIPDAAAAFFVFYWSRRSDRTGKRAAHASISMLIAATGLTGAAFLLPVNPVAALVFLTIAAMGVFSATAPLLSMPSAALGGAAAAAGLALVNAIGNVGGFVAPYAVGLLNDATHSNLAGLLFLAACLVITAVATFLYARNRPEGTATPSALAAAELTSTTK